MPSNTDEGNDADGRPIMEWLGVNASKSSGSSVTGVNGRAFKACSTRHTVVVSVSSKVYGFLESHKTLVWSSLPLSPRDHQDAVHWVD